MYQVDDQRVQNQKIQVKQKVSPTPQPKVVPKPLVLSKDSYDCCCCFGTFGKDNLVTCTGASETHQHITCRECVSRYLETVLNSKLKIECMMKADDCGGTYSDFDILMSLDDKLIDRYREYKAVDEATQLASCLDNYHICPFCNGYGIIIDNMPG